VQFYCPRALADSNQHIQIREKTLEFSSTVLSTLSLYRFQIDRLIFNITHNKHTHTRLTAIFFWDYPGKPVPDR